LILAAATRALSGSVSPGQALSPHALPRSAPIPSRIVNLSVETQINAAGSALTVGIFIAGPDSKTMLLRGIGPTLGYFGVPNALATPRLRLFDATGTLLTTVTSWNDDQLLALAFKRTGAFPLTAGAADAAILSQLPPGGYSAQVDGGGYGTGTVLTEFYDADPDVANSASRLLNLSARGVVLNDSPLTAGFVVSGTVGETVLLRGVGPALFKYGIRGFLAKPLLTLFDAAGNVVATNAGWGGGADLAAAFAGVGAFALASASADAAINVFLPPGGYTAQVTGADGGGGLAMVEIYENPY
jgi:hypothetical protein